MWLLVVLLIAGLVALVYSFRGGQSDQTAGADTTINAIYTNAMSTVAAQQLTLQAGTTAGHSKLR